MITINSEDVTQLQSRKRKKEAKNSKESRKHKTPKTQNEAPLQSENVDDSILMMDPTSQSEETYEDLTPPTPDTPVYVPSLSSPEPDTPESVCGVPISHANIDLVTFNTLNSGNVFKLRQERDRLEFGGLRKRHTLLHQLDRSTWPVLFMILQLHGHSPDGCTYEDRADFDPC